MNRNSFIPLYLHRLSIFSINCTEIGDCVMTASEQLTTWRVSAIGFSKDEGEIDWSTAKLKVTSPLHVRPHLPFAVKAGETFVLTATVHNNLNYDAEVAVILHENDGWYNLISEFENGKTTTKRLSKDAVRIIQITRAPRGTDRSPEYNEHFCYKLDSRVKN